jgi:diguanylate cyclase (GGDEF)-like protein
MGRKAARPEQGAKVATPQRSGSSRAAPDKIAGGNTQPQTRPPSRSMVMRLAAEVDALAAQLEDSRARIQDLETLVDVDPLTDTLNRRGFERELRRSLAYVKRYGAGAALVYVDLDDFKPVNDRHGHNAGDAVLKAVAASLIRSVRASDVVARYGGDEFVVLLWNVRGPEAEVKARALETAVYGTPVQWGSSSLVVGASAGVALLGALDTPDEVLARADVAMYARKRERKGLAAPLAAPDESSALTQ